MGLPAPPPNITESLAATVHANCKTAFDAAVSGSTSAKKVWRGSVPWTDSAKARQEMPGMIWSITDGGRDEEQSNFDQEAPLGFVDITVASRDCDGVSGADETAQIAAQIEAQLVLSNLSPAGWDLLKFTRAQNAPRDEKSGESRYFYRDMIFTWSAYPS